MSEKFRRPSPEDQTVLDKLEVRLLEPQELKRCHQLLEEHHYLGSVKPVGERLYYVVSDSQGDWLALLVLAAAAKHLKDRDRWIGWTDVQREKGFAFVGKKLCFFLLSAKN